MQPDPSTCEHCPDGHGTPARCAWAAWVAAEVDSDGQPTHLRVAPTDGAHVAEADAEWLRSLIRAWRPLGVYAMPDPPADPNTRVRDRKGNVWRHSPVDTTLWRVVGRPGMAAEWFGLLAHYGPLTEVSDGE